MSTRQRWLLALIVLVAFWARVQGITFGLDLNDPERSIFDGVDENGMVESVQKSLSAGDLHPREFLNRGPGGFLVFLVLDLPLVGWRALGDPDGWDGAVRSLQRDPTLLHLNHRLTSALSGVLSVWLVALLAARLFDPRAGLLAAAVLAVAYQHVRDGHFGRVDMIAAFFTLATVERASVLLSAPRTRTYVVAGLLAGATFAIKYFGIAGCLPIAIAHWLGRAQAREEEREPPPHRRLILGLAAVPVGCLLFFPGIVIAWDDLLALLDRQSSGLGADGLASMWAVVVDHLVNSFAVGLGETAFAAACVGLVLAWRGGRSGRFLVLSLAALSAILLAVRYSPLRFADPQITLLAIPAGLALSRLWSRVPVPVGLAAVALALAPSTVRTIAFVRIRPRLDTRAEMLDVLRRLDLPPEEIQAVGNHQGMPHRATDDPLMYTSYAELLGLGRRKLIEEGGRDPEFPRRLQEFLDDPPRMILWNDTVSFRKPRGIDEIAELVQRRYRVYLRLDGRNEPIVLMDPISRQFMPYRRPWLMHRPGPTLILYERIDPPPDEER